MSIKEKLVAKIETLEWTDKLLEEVYNYVRFLEHKEEQEKDSVLSEKSFDAIWSNEEDAIYDQFLPKV